jgi:hypothetical protein
MHCFGLREQIAAKRILRARFHWFGNRFGKAAEYNASSLFRAYQLW